MDKNKLKEFSQKCPYQLGESVAVAVVSPLKIWKKSITPWKQVKSQKITDIEILQIKETEKATFVYKLENSKKYYRLKKGQGKEGRKFNKKVRISLKRCKLWPYFPNEKKCG